MGQIIGGAAKPKRCNINQLSQLGTPAAGEHILVSSDNSMNAAGQGDFDCYIVGDGRKAATALELKEINHSQLETYFNESEVIEIPDSSWENGYYIKSGGAVATTGNNSSVLRMFDISAYENIRVYGNTWGNYYNALYDENQQLIKTFQCPCFIDLNIKALGAKYISLGWVSISTSYVPQIVTLEKGIEERVTFRNYNGYLSTNYIRQNNDMPSLISTPIRVQEGDVYRLHAWSYGSSSNQVLVYNKQGGKVGALSVPDYNGGYWCNYTIPAGGYYMILGSRKWYLDFYKIENLAQEGIINAKGSWQALGTSITWYDKNPFFSVSSGVLTQGYVSFLQKEMYFKDFLNSGSNGSKIASAIDLVQNYDYYTIEHGTNDVSTPLGTFNDFINATGTTTFAGTYRALIDAIYTANANAKIILCTPNQSNVSPRTFASLNAIADMIKEIAEYCALPVADFFNDCQINELNFSATTIDRLHPNDVGHKRMAAVLKQAFLKSIPAKED